MKIKLLYPTIHTELLGYHTLSDSLVVNLGNMTTHTNTAMEHVSVIVRLIDIHTSEVINSETVQVRLNTFGTAYTLNGLVANRLYALIIDSLNNRMATTIISTMTDFSAITVVGREKIFDHLSQFYGQDIERPVFEPGPVNFRKGLDLINRTEGSTVIIENGQIYTFCPTHVITTLSAYPSVIDYRPLPGMPLCQIMVHKIPRIIKRSKRSFVISPPTRMRIVNMRENKDILTQSAVDLIDLNDYGLTSEGTVLIPCYGCSQNAIPSLP